MIATEGARTSVCWVLAVETTVTGAVALVLAAALKATPIESLRV